MSQKTIRRIHLCYGIAVSVVTTALSILLILSCLDIYRGDTPPFSREAVSARLDKIAFALYAAIVAVLGGALLSLLLPLDDRKPRAIREESALLSRLAARLGAARANDPLCRRELRLRMVLRAAAILAVILSGLYPTVYFFDASHFTIVNYNDDVIRATCYVLAATVVSLLVCILCTYLCAASRRREIVRLKELLAQQVRSEQTDAAPHDGTAPVHTRSRLSVARVSLSGQRRAIVIALRCVLLVLSILFIVLGVLNGDVRDVLLKATQICTECVGIG